ncbi:MAG TPA: glycoside hydrolase family 16 protein [Pyrinomonadaceae bacterium]|nr:glycoside hydrolase family 16 protein [Pyrinomonadaceae bacterium]
MPSVNNLSSGMVRGPLLRLTLLLAALCVALLGGCRPRAGGGPAVEFRRVPQAEASRTEKLDVIQGSVSGAKPGQQIVLYARAGAWWLQPLPNAPYTKIQPDSTWVNSTHLGTEYAALLVEPGYRPRATLEELPGPGGEVVAVSAVKGAAAPPSPMLQFAGYEWRIRTAPSSRGDTMNLYDPANAWTDADGALHLRIAGEPGRWTCAEVALTRSFGYGTYTFVVRDASQLEPAAVLAMFTWDYSGAEASNREMDVEISRWGDPASKNAQYVVQPFHVPANVARFDAPAGALTHSFRWEPGRVTFRTVRGVANAPRPEVVSEHVFTSGVPVPGVETVRIAFYVFGQTGQSLRKGAEVVVEKFEYLP